MSLAAPMECLDDNDASEFASGSLVGEAATVVERHLATCRDCRALVAALAPGPDGDDGDVASDVITSPRRVAMGKRGKRDVATAPTERPGHPAPTGPARPRDPVVVAGDEIGRYIILARLGAGGMGVVFTAYDPQLDRKVALKLLRTGSGLAEAEARARMIREAQAIAQLAHPNVVAVYDVDTAATGDVYIAMEFVEGETLTSWLGHWERSWRDILEMFFQAGRGLAAAHARGLMHRDFKPDNVLVGADQRVRVTDFGLARSLIDQVEELARDHAQRPDLEALRVTLTATGTVLGTPRYMAPEQLRGVTADSRSDQFSFCVALYEALYGSHPIPGDSVIEMVQHGAEPEPPPTDTKVPAAIGKAIMRGLSPDPNKRFPSMAALLVELTPPPVHRVRRTWAAVAAGVALAAGGAAAATLMRGEDTSRTAELERKLDALIAERDALNDQLERLINAPTGMKATRQQVAQLEQALAERERKIAELEQVVRASAVPPPDAAPRVRPAPAVDAGPPPPKALDDWAFAKAIGAVEGRIRSCLSELAERKPDQNVAVVTLNVSPDGQVLGTTARGLPGSFTPECVMDAVRAAVFPPSTGITLGEVRMIITDDGQLDSLTARVTGARAPGDTIDLAP